MCWSRGFSRSGVGKNWLKPKRLSAIKTADPNIIVISGALAPTGFNNGSNAWADDRYLAGMRSAGAASYMDCIGVHHNAGATSPYAVTGHGYAIIRPDDNCPACSSLHELMSGN